MSGRALLLEKALPPLYWLLLAAALVILFRGHNAPGGGFIAGLVAVSASAAWAIVLGRQAALGRMPLPPMALGAMGVLLALVSGLPAVALGQPYLTHLWASLPLGLTDLKLSTVMLFDLGVFFAVWGALAGFVLALLPAGGEPS